jgi:hypothetical protein
VNGISFDQQARSADLGVLVIDRVTVLPTTGTGIGSLVVLAVALALLGRLILSPRGGEKWECPDADGDRDFWERG